MKIDSLFLTPIFLPLLGAGMILISKSFFPTKIRRFTEYLGITLGLALPLIIVLLLYPTVAAGETLRVVIGSYTPSIGIIYKFDGLSLVMIVLSILVTFPSWLYSRKVGPAHSYFTALILIQTSTIAAISMTADIFNLFVCLEIIGLVAYVLISSKQDRNAVYAAFTYMMYSSASMVFFLLGAFGIYKLTGSLSYEGITEALKTLPDREQTIALLSLILLIVPVLLRVAIMPLSGWLINAHSKAPHSVSALLSGILIKIPLFALIRVFSLSTQTQVLALPLSYAGAATALIAVLFALSQSDAKKLLAYHSISQIGYIVTAWALALHHGIGTKVGALLLISSFAHAFTHAIFKALLFLSIGKATDAAKSRDVYKIRGVNRLLKNEGEILPLTMICFFVGALSIMAIPPFNGYFSKTILTYSMKGTIHYQLLTLTGVATVASFIKLSRIFLPAKKGAVLLENKQNTKFPLTIHLSLVLLATIAVLTGFFAKPLLSSLEALIGPTNSLSFSNSFFYSKSNLLKTLYTFFGGILLFFVATSKIGSKVTHKLRKIKSDFSDQFFHFALTIFVLAVFILV